MWGTLPREQIIKRRLLQKRVRRNVEYHSTDNKNKSGYNTISMTRTSQQDLHRARGGTASTCYQPE